MYLFLCIFFVYAFLGWCTEVSYAALVTGRFVNRGFLNGPVCPIYGFGAAVVLACLEPLAENLPLLFAGSVLLTSALEWLTGFLLEKLFHQRWWDYSDEPFNLNGYICLRFSLAWGLACLFVVKLLHPSVLLALRLLPKGVGSVLLALSGVVMAVDLAATLRTIAHINRSLGQIDELAEKIRQASNEFGENLAERVLDAAERGEEIRGELAERSESLREERAERREERLQRWAERQEELLQLHQRLRALMDAPVWGQQRLMTAFPKLRSLDHGQALERLRRRMDRFGH